MARGRCGTASPRPPECVGTRRRSQEADRSNQQKLPIAAYPSIDQAGSTTKIPLNAASSISGDEFTTGDGRRFRILGIVPVDDDVGVFNALWKVEPFTNAD